MTIFIPGISRCCICRETIQKDEAIVGFTPFVLNEHDSIYMFNDASAHESCFDKHPLRSVVESRHTEWIKMTDPRLRICAVCKQNILSWDEYFLIPFLASTPEVSRFHFTHLHRSCIPKWDDRLSAIGALRELSKSQVWKGVYLDKLIRDLQEGIDEQNHES